MIYELQDNHAVKYFNLKTLSSYADDINYLYNISANCFHGDLRQIIDN